MNKKAAMPVAFLIILLFSALASTMAFDTVQASTNVIGILNSDTTWTKANSPYTLTGPVAVNAGVTLTIEAGTTVNLNSYYIQVSGTLRATGSSADQIHFNSGNIKFTESSNEWNEQTESGCIIENAVLNSVTILSLNAIKLNSDSINGDVTVNGASIVSSNTIVGTVNAGGSTVVWKNTVTGGISGGVDTTSEKYPIISNNNISGGSGYEKYGIGSTGYALIVDNTVTDCNYGIDVFTGRTQFGGSIAPNAILERNKITGNTQGIHLEIYPAMVYGSINPSILSNTISNNTIGIYLDGDAGKLTIQNNNIQDNSNYSIKLASDKNLNATHNWWGTTDTQAINQTIHDFKNDFNLGTVNFIPFLSEPNPQATPDESSPLPTPSATPSPTPALTSSPTPTSASPTPNLTTSPTQTANPTTQPTPSPSQNPTATPTAPQGEFSGTSTAIIIVLIVTVAALSAALLLVLKRKKQ